ncbi:MAG: ABC transporter substrate-binding protein [Bacteroidia bacterium]|nr:ABC transporter substrate-binding protein [Bacteroidia bacterium]
MNGRAFFLIGLFLALFFSCKETSQSVTEGDYTYTGNSIIYAGQKSNDVVVQVVAQPSSLHPTNGRTRVRDRILDLISQELIDLDVRTGKMVPILLKELPVLSEDGTQFTAELDPDAKWPDGKQITAEDILFSYKAAACPLTNNPAQKVYGEYLKNIVPDSENPLTVNFLFTEYYINNLDMLGVFQIMDKRVYDPKGLLDPFSVQDMYEDASLEKNAKVIAWAEEFNKVEYGKEKKYINSASGPYMMEEWIDEQMIVLKKRDNYWGNAKESYYHHSTPPSISFKFLRDADALELQLAGEEIDVAEMGTESFKRLIDDELVGKNYRLESKERATFVSLPLNHKPTSAGRPPFFTEKKVRQAISYALPIEEMITSFVGDERFAIRVASPVSQMSQDHNPNLSFYNHDPEKAKKLLEEAGWTDTNGDLIRDKEINGKQVDFEFTLLYPANNQTLVGFANKIKEELAKVGINCNPDGVTGRVVQQKLWTHDYDMGMLALGSSHLPYDFHQLFYSQNWPEGDNIYGFANEEADDLILKARTESDKEKREVMVNRIQEILYDEKPCIFLYAPTKKLAIHKRFNEAETYSIIDHLILNDFKVIR